MGKKKASRVVRGLRAASGLTQEQFAAKVGVTVSTVNRWEKGKSEPSPLAKHTMGELQKELRRNNER